MSSAEQIPFSAANVSCALLGEDWWPFHSQEGKVGMIEGETKVFKGKWQMLFRMSLIINY